MLFLRLIYPVLIHSDMLHLKLCEVASGSGIVDGLVVYGFTSQSTVMAMSRPLDLQSDSLTTGQVELFIFVALLVSLASLKVG